MQLLSKFTQVEISDLVFRRPVFAPNGFLCDFVDGSVFKEHDLFVILWESKPAFIR